MHVLKRPSGRDGRHPTSYQRSGRRNAREACGKLEKSESQFETLAAEDLGVEAYDGRGICSILPFAAASSLVPHAHRGPTGTCASRCFMTSAAPLPDASESCRWYRKPEENNASAHFGVSG